MPELGAFVVNLLAAAIAYGTPLLLAGLGEVICERGGVINLGLDGLMLLGAMLGVLVGLATGSALLGALAAMAGAAALSSLHALASVTLRADQIVSGLSLGFLASGLAAVVGAPLVGAQAALPRFAAARVSLPVLGPLLLSHHALTYAALGLAPTLWWLLHRTRPGLHLRAVGENPAAADSLGVPVAAYRFAAVMAGGALAGLAGASLSLALTPGYVDGMTSGAGWIALGLTIVARWDPLRVLPGALLFGALRRLPLDLQGLGLPLLSSPHAGYFLNMLPYLCVVAVLVWGGRRAQATGRGAPAALGLPYVRGERGR